MIGCMILSHLQKSIQFMHIHMPPMDAIKISIRDFDTLQDYGSYEFLGCPRVGDTISVSPNEKDKPFTIRLNHYKVRKVLWTPRYMYIDQPKAPTHIPILYVNAISDEKLLDL